jgi:putative FmdB family regulatory protein
MPLVEYRCADCRDVFERLVPSTQGAEHADCPNCGPAKAQRLLSVFATTRAESASSPSTSAAAGGCCGGGCCGSP